MPPPIHPDGPRRLDAPLSNTRNDRHQSRRSNITWRPIVHAMSARFMNHPQDQSMMENSDYVSPIQLPSYSPLYPTFNGLAIETDSDEAHSSASSSALAELRMSEDSARLLDSYGEDLFVSYDTRDEMREPVETDDISSYVPNAPEDLAEISSSDAELSDSDTTMNDADGVDNVERMYYPETVTAVPDRGLDAYAMRDGFEIATPGYGAVRIRRLLDGEESFEESSETSPDVVHSVENESGVEDAPRVIGGVPLRRQNAIRRSMPAPPSILSKKYRKALKHNLRSLLRDILSKSPSFGACPLYADSYLWRDKLFPIMRPSCPHHEVLNLDNRMDKLLARRKRPNSGFSESIPARGAHSFKRKGKTLPARAKRQKLKPSASEYTRDSAGLMFLQGSSLCAAHLSESNKNRILDVSPTSFLTDGSCFDLSMGGRRKGIELAFTRVGQDSPGLDGFFNFAIDQKADGMSPLCDFLTKLVGKGHTGDQKILKDTLGKALKGIRDGFQKNGQKKNTHRFTLPFVGKVVDFKRNDLRYGPKKRGREHSHMKVRNNSVRLQLIEWLRVRPFSYLTETFLLHQLHLAINCLTNFSRIPEKFRKAVGSFCKDVLDESWLLTKHFESFDQMQISAITKSYTLCQRRTSGEARFGHFHRLGETSFTQMWNSELCDKLAHSTSSPNSCLLNLQLNYVLFTVDVDIYQAVNRVLDLAHEVAPQEFPENHPRMMKAHESKNSSSMSPQKVTFLCSLNRKTGAIEMQRARAEGEFEHPLSRRGYENPRESSMMGPSLYDMIHIEAGARSRADDMTPLPAAEKMKPSIIRGTPKRGRSFASSGR